MKYRKIRDWSIVQLFKIEDFGLLLINNRSHNKISNPIFIDIDELEESIKEEKLKGLIITGKGKNFSVGADIDEIRSQGSDMISFIDQLRVGKNILNYIEKLNIPTVAAVNGFCFGAGLEIALSCHFRFGTPKTVLSLPESTLGFLPGLAGTYRLPKLLGKSKAIDIILTGRTIHEDESLKLGLLDHIVPKEELMEYSLEYIRRLTKGKEYLEIKMILSSIMNIESMPKNECMEYEGEIFRKLVQQNLWDRSG